jgi:hypothetical protein
MPIAYARETGGYDVTLDGKHGLWDEEYIVRMDRYVEEHGLQYFRHPRTIVYEVEHERPWASAGEHDPTLLSQADRG